jgi:protein O-mannosyl-transferase
MPTFAAWQAKDGADAPTHRRQAWNLAVALLLLWATLIAYWPAVGGGVLWDDPQHLSRAELRSLDGLSRIWLQPGATQQYYPLLHSAFWLEFRVWGNALWAYHLWNIALHALSALLVVWIVRRLALPGAWLAGFFFALHPVHVESVAWIAEQKSTLSGVFYLGSVLAYLHFDETRRRWQYLLAFGLYVLALATKTVTATLPARLLVVLWWRKGRLEWKRDIRPLAGWIALGAGAGMVTALVEKSMIRTAEPTPPLSWLQHLLLAGRVVWFYAGKLLWPVDLNFSYPRWTIDATEWWQYLFPLGAAAVLLASWFLARRNRGPMAALLIFGGTLVPVLGFLDVYPFRYSWVADHFQYLASPAILISAASLLTIAAQRMPLPRGGAAALAALLALGLGCLSWRQAHWYKDSETLYREILARNPGSFLATNNLCGTLLNEPGLWPEAATPCLRAVELRPDLALAHMNLGALWMRVPGRQADAVGELRTAVRLRPNYAMAHVNLGNALADMPGDQAEVLAEFEAARQAEPEWIVPYVRLGDTLAQMPGRLTDAAAAYRQALRIAPADASAHYGLGQVLAQMPGRQRDAIAEFEATLDSQPDWEQAYQMLQRLRRAAP